MKNCIPTVIALLFTGLYSIIDGLFIGNAVGDVGLAAINLAWPIPAFITAVGFGIGTGGSVLYSIEMGKGNKKNADFILRTALCYLILAGITATLLLMLSSDCILKVLGATGATLQQAKKYSSIIIGGSIFQISGAGLVPLLRNTSKPVKAMCTMICGMLVNLGINYVLIIECGFGMKGAAIGTIAAQMVVCIICMIEVRKVLFRSREKEKTGSARILVEAGKITKAGIAAFGTSMAPTIVLALTNWQCLTYGGNHAVAAYAVISYIVFPIQSLLQGIGEGLQPLMSYYVGAKENKLLSDLRKIAYAMIAVLSIVTLALAFATQGQIKQFFHLEGKTAYIFSEGFLISACSFLFYGFSKFNVSYLNARLEIKKASALTYAESLLIAPIFIYGLPKILGIYGIWYALPLTSVVLITIYLLMLLWKKEFKKNEISS